MFQCSGDSDRERPFPETGQSDRQFSLDSAGTAVRSCQQTHHPPRENWDRRLVSIDYYNNYMTNFHDNTFEIDGSMHHARVMRNIMINSASHPFCNQPAIGSAPPHYGSR